MKKRPEWRKALSVMLAVSMMLQSCTVVSAGETEAEIIVEHEGQSSGNKETESKKSDFPEISIESVTTESNIEGEDITKSEAQKDAVFTVTFDAHSADHGVIRVGKTDLNEDALSSYKKEVKGNGKYTFQVTAADGYIVDRVTADNQEIPRVADKTDTYEIAAVARDTVIAVTYKERESQETNDTVQGFQRAALTVGQQSYIMGQEGSEHTWDILDETIISVVSTDGALAELKANAEGIVYIAHSYVANGESDIRMETFEVTVTAAGQSATEAPETESVEEPEAPETENGEEPEAPETENGEEPETPETENGEEPEAPETENGEEPETPETEMTEAQADTVEHAVAFEVSEGAVVTVDGVDATNTIAVAKNGAIEFTVIADEGYEVTDVLVEGTGKAGLNQATRENDNYIIEGILTDDTVVRVKTQAVISEAEGQDGIKKAAARSALAPMAAEAGIMAAADNAETIVIGETQKLYGTTDGNSHEWTTGDSNIAVVSGSGSTGTVQGINAGTVTITHRYNKGKKWTSETFQVTVVGTEYTLTFHANGGSNAPSAITVAYDAENKEVILPDQGSMRRDGYTFMGWGETEKSGMANQSNGGDVTIYPAGYTWLIEENKTLYAVWAQKNREAYYFVRLDGNIPDEPGNYGASDYTDELESMKGIVKYDTFYADTINGVNDHLGTIPSTRAIREACNAKASKIRFGDGSGYIPCQTDSEFEEKYYVLWYVIKQSIHVDGVLLKKNLYNVIYNPNALEGQYTGTVPIGAQYAQGIRVTVSGTDLKRDGYTFLGWSRDPYASEPEYVQGNTFAMPGENVVLYAVWRPNNNTAYKVEYYYQKEDGSYPDQATLTSSMRYGVTDRTARVTGADKTPDAAYPNYTEDSTNDKKIYEAIVKADGSTVLKVYFKRQINIAGTKTWIAPVGSEHPEIVIYLLRDGKKIQEVSLAGQTEYSFGKFDQFDEEGNPYDYAVEEAAVNGYTTTYQGYNITNTIVQDHSIVVSGTKTWVVPADTEVPSITINLLRDGVQIDSVTLEPGTTEYTFSNLPKYALDNGGDGHVYEYTVEEKAVAGYTSVQNGNNFTNTIAQDNSVSVSGTKTWIDPVGTKHPEITIYLLQDGKRVASTTLADGETEYTFENLEKYDLIDGHVYQYTVEETPVEGYASVRDGYDFTNTINQDNTVSVSGIKTWIAPGGTEYPEITINLLQDGVKIDSQTLADGTTSYAFTELERYDLEDGHAYEYTVEEEAVEGYTSVQSGNNFTNTIAQDTSVVVSGTKTWIDPEGTVHPTITVTLLQDGEVIDSRQLADGTTEYTFENLDKYDLSDGHVYRYTVREEAVEGYTSVQNGYDFTNTIAQDTSVIVSGTKTWIDPVGTVHPTITINLLRDGKKIDSRELAHGTTEYRFENLDKYDLTDGHVYVYTVEEEPVEGYSRRQNGTDFVNTIAQDISVSVSGTKTWIAPEGMEHPEITIRLLRDGKEVDAVTLANGETKYAFENLPKYDLRDGHVYVYRVKEDPVAGYTGTQSENDFTNTIAQDSSVSVSGTKTWIDPEGTVHPDITINLLCDGEKLDSVTLKDGTTDYAFTGLDKYDLSDGHVYEYTVEEEAVAGYTSTQNGTHFTNTITQDKSVSVSGTKTWIDPVGTEHPEITIYLLRDGERVATTTIADGETGYVFENLDKYDLTDGHVYQYTVEEAPVEGYASVRDGYDFTNTINQDNTVSVSGIKTWIAPGGTEYPEITINLLQDGVKIDSQTLADGTTSYAFTELERYDLEDGHAYEYTVEEEAVEGYTSVQNGNNFTNTIAQDKSVSVSGTKTWIDPEGTVHPTITVTLLQDGEAIDSRQLADGTTEYTFENLDKYDLSDGHVYRYTVREEAVEGYTSVQNGNDFTNTIVQDMSVSVSGTKIWIDPVGTEHPEITINLLRDGVPYDMKTLQNGQTGYSFTGLPKYDLNDGHVYEYTVEEEDVEGYTGTQTGNDFTNTIAQDHSVVVSGTKTWIDPEGTEHPEITFTLLRDGVEVGTTTLTDGETEYVFENLPKYDLTDGHVYHYTVREEPVEGYTSAQSGNNFTNTIAQDKRVSVSGTKTWIDPVGTVHPNITVNLLRDGVEIASRTLADGETAYTFENLDKYDLTDGHVYEYTVEEEAVEGYTSAQNGTDITNTIVQDNSVSISGIKTWVDPAGTVHPEITIQLLRDGEVIQRLTLADGETEYAFDRLPKYDLTDGHVYEYTVEEVSAEGYTGTQDGNDITNTINQDYSVVVSGTKTWNMLEGETYPAITVNLLRDGVMVDSQVLENGAASYTFENLPKYAVGTVDGYTGAYDGHAFVYTVTENDVPGYTKTQDGTALTNTAETTSVEVTKSWQDGEGNALAEELIPEELTVTLLRQGVAYGEPVVLNDANGWSYRIEGLPTHDETGAPYSYSVRETQIEGFTGTETVQATLKTAEITEGYEAALVNVRSDETPVEPTKTHTAPKIQVEGTTQMVEVGETVTYAITYYNHNNTAADVTITDTLPTGLEYVESDPEAEVSGQTVTWTFEQVAPFTGGTVNVTARVTQEALTAANPVLDNRAEITLGDARQETNTDSVTVYHPEWTVDKTVSGMTGAMGENGVQSARVGDELTYLVTIANTGNVTITKPVTDVFLIDGEEARPQLHPTEESQGIYENGSITLAPGETAILMSVYTVKATDNQLLNTVRAGSEPEDPEKQVPTDVEDNPDWTVEKQLVNEGTGANNAFVLGETAQFDITITNTGNTKLENLTVSEIAGAVFAEDPEGRYTVDAQTNTAIVTLEEQEAVTIRAEYTVGEADLNRTDLENVATATLGEKEVPSNPVPFIPEERNPRLEVTKTVTSVPAAADGKYVVGEEITYQVTVRNTGNLTMQDLDVLDTLTRPENNGTVVPSGFEDVLAAFENAILAPNKEVTVTYSYIVTEQDLGGELVNAVTASGAPAVPNPDPERPDPNPGNEDEVPVVTEDPSDSSIVVTKQLTDAFENPVTVGAATFYVSLFEDEALTRRVGDVRAINFTDTQATSGVTFDGLQRGVYYVAETDAQGNVLRANIEHEGGLFSPAYANGQQVTIAQNGANAAFEFSNQFLVLPSGYYAYVTNLAITKRVRSSQGRAQKSNETFYAGVFLDEAHTRLATEDDGVSQSIVPISMSGNAEATVNIEVANPQEGQRSFYITEVSADGTPVEQIANFAYDWEVENEIVTVESDTTDASVTITNTVVEQDEAYTDTVIENSSENTEQNGQKVESAGMAKMNTKSVKTGDETPIFGFALLLTASALILLILEERRRRRRSGNNQ